MSNLVGNPKTGFPTTRLILPLCFRAYAVYYDFYSCKKDSVQMKIVILFLLAHLSRRLTGELIGYPWIRRPSVGVVRPSTFSNIFSSETAWPIKAKFYVEPPWEGGTKVYINYLGHMTKMAAMPMYGKNPSKIFFSRTGEPIFMKLGM